MPFSVATRAAEPMTGPADTLWRVRNASTSDCGAAGMMTGGAMNQRLYHPNEPFPANRLPADTEQSIDHFFAKLLGLHRTMQTESGRDEARRRSAFLVVFLRQLADEIGVSQSALDTALQRIV